MPQFILRKIKMTFETYTPKSRRSKNANADFSQAMLNAYPSDIAETVKLNDGTDTMDIYDIMNTAVMVKVLKGQQYVRVCGIPRRIEDKVIPDIQKKTKWNLALVE